MTAPSPGGFRSLINPYPGNSQWPADYGGCNLTGRYVGLDGSPIAGTLTLTATPTVIVDTASDTIVVPAPLTITLDRFGAFAITVPATDDPDISPRRFTYTVTENFKGGRQYSILAPVGETVDLTDAAPVPDSAGTPIYRGRDGTVSDVFGGSAAHPGTAQVVTGPVLSVNGIPAGADGDVPLPLNPRVLYLEDFFPAHGGDNQGGADCFAALAAAINALPTQNGQALGVIEFGAGQFRFNHSTHITSPCLRIRGQGKWVTTVKYTGNGAWVSWTSTPAPANSDVGATQFYNTIPFGGGITGIAIDGSNAVAGAGGVHITGMEEGDFDVACVHFNQAGSYGFSATCDSWWIEKCTFRLQLVDNSTHLILGDGPNHHSHEYNVYDLTVYANPGQDMVWIRTVGNGPLISGCRFNLRGNMHAGATAPTPQNCVFRIDDNTAFSDISFHVAIEQQGAGPFSAVPAIIGNNVLLAGVGYLRFSGGDTPWLPSTYGANLRVRFLGITTVQTAGPTQLDPVFGSLGYNRSPVVVGGFGMAPGIVSGTQIDPQSSDQFYMPIGPLGTNTFGFLSAALPGPQNKRVIITNTNSSALAILKFPTRANPDRTHPTFVWPGNPPDPIAPGGVLIVSLVSMDGATWYCR